MFKKNTLRKYTDEQLSQELIARWELNHALGFPGEFRKEIIRRKLEGKVLDEFNEEQFQKSKQTIEERVQHIGSNPQDRMTMLKSLRRVVSLDMSYSHIAELAYSLDVDTKIGHLPITYKDERGELHELKETIETVVIQDKYLVHAPYQTDKWLGALKRTENLDPRKFREDISEYFPEINLIIQGNGSTHRMPEAYINRIHSRALVRKYDDTPLYEHIDTNGYRWLNTHTGEELSVVTDFRLALIFMLRKKETDIS